MRVRSARRPGETVASYTRLVDRLCPPYPAEDARPDEPDEDESAAR